jgi:alpha-1,2-mannosyltransferase
MGYAFTFNLIKLLGRVNVGAYVHYPTISHEMLARVRSRQHGYTNSSMISSSAVLSQGKLLYVHIFLFCSHTVTEKPGRYYRFLMFYYAQSLRKASFVMVNSSWTKAHIDSILTHSDQLIEFLHYLPPFMLFKSVGWMRSYGPALIVYPPCDTRKMTKFSLTNRQRVIVSVAQFRLVYFFSF